jgi:hypothetical protein
MFAIFEYCIVKRIVALKFVAKLIIKAEYQRMFGKLIPVTGRFLAGAQSLSRACCIRRDCKSSNWNKQYFLGPIPELGSEKPQRDSFAGLT